MAQSSLISLCGLPIPLLQAGRGTWVYLPFTSAPEQVHLRREFGRSQGSCSYCKASKPGQDLRSQKFPSSPKFQHWEQGYRNLLPVTNYYPNMTRRKGRMVWCLKGMQNIFQDYKVDAAHVPLFGQLCAERSYLPLSLDIVHPSDCQPACPGTARSFEEWCEVQGFKPEKCRIRLGFHACWTIPLPLLPSPSANR